MITGIAGIPIPRGWMVKECDPEERDEKKFYTSRVLEKAVRSLH